jgi:predicted transcriptional regulator
MPEKQHVAKIVAAFAKRNILAADQLPGLIATVHGALSSAGGAEPAEPPMELVPAVSVRRSIKPSSITCLDCGYEGQMLKRHLTTAHGLTPDAYRQRWSFKSDYPMVAPSYSARRSELAKAIGFGKRGRGRKARQPRR